MIQTPCNSVARIGFGSRIEQAILDYQSQIGERVTLARFATEVGEAEEERRRAYRASTVSEWIRERGEPSLRAFLAIEAVTGVRAEYLMLGRGAKRLDESAPAAPERTGAGVDAAGLSPLERELGWKTLEEDEAEQAALREAEAKRRRGRA